MDKQFWSHSRSNLKNPTFLSNHIFANFNFYKPLEYQSPQKISSSNISSPSNSQIQPSNLIRKNSQILSVNRCKDHTNPQNSSNHFIQQNPIKKSSFSFSSLPSLSSARQIYLKQARNQNIITLDPKPYKDQIRIFPKLRMENVDDHFQRRQSFLKGQPQKARRTQKIDVITRLYRLKISNPSSEKSNLKQTLK